jgi:predicted PurR-regulated permease PerM
LLFFLLSLALSLLISGAVFVGLLKSLQINWERRNKRPISYLSPVLLTTALLILMAFLTIPRLLDTISLISRDYGIEEIHVEKSSLGWNSLKSGKRLFIYNQWQYKLQPDKTYQITYMPRSGFILDLVEIAETTEVKP